MRYHVRAISDPPKRAAAARQILQTLAQTAPLASKTYGMVLNDEITRLKEVADAQLSMTSSKK